MIFRVLLAGLITVAFAACASAQQIVLSADEIEKVLSHGPWPEQAPRDPSNRVSGNADAIALGQQLFFTSELSADNRLSCSSCHQPERAFTDGLPRAEGRRRLDRNTPSLFNLGHNRWFGWGGRSDNLWAQSIVPILNPDEFGVSAEGLKDVVSRQPIRASYASVFGNPQPQAPTSVLVNIGKALAAYQETITTGKTEFDKFRDALATEDRNAAAAYPVSAQRGLALFVGRGNCSLCHTGPLFTNGEFDDAGVPYFVAADRVDSGRHGGITALLESPFTLAGSYSDDPTREGAWAVRQVARKHADFGSFRVPGLRNVAKTAPYMHNGSLPDLEAVVHHYATINEDRLHSDGQAILAPLALSPQETLDLVHFLETLSSGAD